MGPPVDSDSELGRYRLVQRVGEGGMGVVHLALDPAGRTVAVKVLRPHVAADPNARERLAREVSTLQRVRHPRVAEVLDADTDGDLPYVVTRYVAGPPLDDFVALNGPLSGAALARLGEGLGEALAAIHSAGVVHRDLKPGNVLMLDDGPVVIDFGIAHVADDVRLTSTGLVMGTPGYLSPEVLDGQAVSQATDWWGWAATMAFAATGRPPFGRGPVESVLDRVRRGSFDLDGVPAVLVPVLTAALAPNPAERPPPSALRVAVETLRRQSEAPADEGWAAVPREPATMAMRSTPPTRALPVQPPHEDERAPLGGVVPGGPLDAGVGYQASQYPSAHQYPPAQQHEPAQRYEPASRSATPPAFAAPPRLTPTPAEGVGGVGWPAREASGYAAPPEYGVPPRDFSPPYASPSRSAAPPASRPAMAGAGEAPAQERVRSYPEPRTGLLAAGLLALLGVSAVAPGAALIVAALWAVLARTVNGAHGQVLSRRSEYGPRRSDVALAVAASPWHLLRAVVTSAFALVMPLLGAGATGYLVGMSLRGEGSVRAVPVVAGALVAVVVSWWGPWGGSLRRGSRVLARAVTPGPTARGLLTIVLVLVAAAALILVLRSGYSPDWVPLPAPAEILSQVPALP